jgi:hypothetical protein
VVVKERWTTKLQLYVMLHLERVDGGQGIFLEQTANSYAPIGKCSVGTIGGKDGWWVAEKDSSALQHLASAITLSSSFTTSLASPITRNPNVWGLRQRRRIPVEKHAMRYLPEYFPSLLMRQTYHPR